MSFLSVGLKPCQDNINRVRCSQENLSRSAHLRSLCLCVVLKGAIMPTPLPVLDAILQGWKEYQDQLVVIVRPRTPEQLALRGAPNLRSAGEIAAHLIASRADWFFGVLKERGDDMAAITQWQDLGPPGRTAADFGQVLEELRTLMRSPLQPWT